MNFKDEFMSNIWKYKLRYSQSMIKLYSDSACDRNTNAWSLTHVSNTCSMKERYENLPKLRQDLSNNDIETMKKQRITYFSNVYENNVLLLAVSKGHNHYSDEDKIKQSDNIDYILSQQYVDKGYVDTKNGLNLTAIEIAILRHDDIELINKLIDKRAEIPSKERIKNLLSLSYRDVQIAIDIMTGGIGKQNTTDKKYGNKNKFWTFTLPTKEQFKENKDTILERFGIEKETPYHKKLGNVFKSIVEPAIDLWMSQELGIIGKIASIISMPLLIVTSIIAMPFAPFLAMSDGYSNEKQIKAYPKSKMENNNDMINSDSRFAERENNKNLTAMQIG